MNQELPHNEPRTMSVPWDSDGERFDVVSQYLAKDWFSPSLSRSIIQEAISQGTILLQGVSASPSHRVSKGDKVLFTEAFFRGVVKPEERRTPEGEEPAVISRNELFLVVYKPAGWLTHEVAHYQEEATLEDWLLKKSLIPAGLPSNGRVHRLDRNTSGLLIYARTPEAQEELKSLFQSRKVEKRYVALVNGHLADHSGTIHAPIIRKTGSNKRIIAKDPADLAAKEAETDYRVVARTKDYDLLVISPKTGRTHQIRVHMAHIGHPLVGDSLYGVEKSPQARHFLHAFSLTFDFQGHNFQFFSPVPQDLKNMLSALDGAALTRYDNEALQGMGL